MKKEIFPLLLVFLLLSGLRTLAQDIKPSLLGDWMYEIPDAGPGYDKGNMVFTEKDGTLVCIVKVQGSEITANSLKVNGDSVTFSTDVQGSTYKIGLKLANGKLSGAVSSNQGTVPMSAVKSNPLLGEWLYEIPQAGPGYDKGSLIFADKEGQVVCVVKVEAGELTATDLKQNADSVAFTTTVDGNSYKISLKRENKKLVGSVDSGQGTVEMTATRKQ